jgi:hypothetical protein
VDEYVVEQLMAEEVWRLIAQELPGESELLVASLSFKYGQKPAEIFARYPDRFPTIGHVYQTKRNVLDRLRRNERLLRLLTADD